MSKDADADSMDRYVYHNVNMKTPDHREGQMGPFQVWTIIQSPLK